MPEYKAEHGHPIIVSREMITAFLQAPATATAREVLDANQKFVEYVPVEDPLVVANVDTPEQYQQLAATSPTRG